MERDSYLITGLGAVSAAGTSCRELLSNLKVGKRSPGRISLFETAIDKPVFSVKEIPAEFKIEGSRTLSLTLTAVAEALSMARLKTKSSLRVGVCLGTTVACQLNDIDFYRKYRDRQDPDWDAITRYLEGNLAEAVAHRYGFTGPQLTVVNACSSGTDAIGVGMSWLKSDLCDIVVAGGADELNRVPLAGFNSLNILSDKPCTPFDKNRTGLNLGEGAGIMVLEKGSAARSRRMDSSLYCLGYGTYADAYHLTAPRPDGSSIEQAINTALNYAGVSHEEIAFINAHGTATRNNDLVEGNVFYRLFGSGAVFYSSKGYTGHTLGAAGAVEAVFTALGLSEGWIPGSAGFSEKDPDIPLCPIQEKTDIRGSFALSTSLAFGGVNSALVIGVK